MDLVTETFFAVLIVSHCTDDQFLCHVNRNQSTKLITDINYNPACLAIPKKWKKQSFAQRCIDAIKDDGASNSEMKLVKIRLCTEKGIWVRCHGS